jgi:hypothetical protein
MSNISDSQRSASHKINMVGITDDTLTSRAGLAPFVRYLDSIGIYPHLERLFGSLRKSRKGQSVSEIFKQLFCFFADGTSSHMVYFDSLKKDEGYAGGIESSSEEMLSSHSMKRFFGKFYHFSYFLFRRLQQKLYCSLNTEQGGQYLLGFAKMDTVLYSNLGMGCRIDKQLIAAGHEDMLRPSSIITGYHGRGNDELVNRALKDFASQKLPFKLFRMNAAFYYIVLTAFFLLEAFKYDSLDGDIIPASAYATTIRRRLFDIAGKIVRHAGRIELKVTRAVMESLRFDEIWRRSNNPPLMFTWA